MTLSAKPIGNSRKNTGVRVMDDRQQRRLDQFIRVKNYATDNAADTATTDAASHLTKISDVITDIEEARTGQGGASAIPHQVLLLGLKRDAQDIARTARAIGQEDFGFETLFPTPAKGNPAAVLLSVDTILAHLIVKPDDDAPTQAAKAARLAKFTAHGLPATFATDLETAREQYDAARAVENEGDAAGVEDTAAIKRLVAEGAKEVEFLDVIFRNIYRRNPDKLAAWASASHLERDLPNDDEEDDNPTPPTPPGP
jgi:hypothetical protein